MKQHTLFLFLVGLLVACQQPSVITDSTSELQLIPADEIITRTKGGTFNYMYAKFKGQDGSELSAEEKDLLNSGKLAKDYYEDAKGVIREVRVRPIVLADKFLDIQRRAIVANPLKEITLLDIPCDSLDALYDEIHETDQAVRSGDGMEDMRSVDQRNQQKVISAITKCGWSEAHLNTIWLVFQHSPSDIMAYYYPELKAYSEAGTLPKSSIALMEDRLLMNNGYKQIYGSQIQNGSLADLEDPELVNERRATMDLGPIEDYITNWGLDFEAEKKRMQAVTN